MPKGLTQIEKARYIYIQLGKIFSYDERYITSESEEEKKQIFNKKIEDMLNRVGIKSKTVLIQGERLGHAITELEIDEKEYFTDLTHDLMNIKTGLKTNEFMIGKPENNQKYEIITEEELKKIDDKLEYTYKRNVYG